MQGVLEKQNIGDTPKLRLPVKAGSGDELFIDIEPGHPLSIIVDIIARERDWNKEELIVIREGEHEALELAILVDAHYPHKHRHHVHHKGNVEAVVFYQTQERKRAFRRSQPLEAVLDWALEEFQIDPAMAAEFVLRLKGSTEELTPSEHLGHLAGKRCEVAFDLGRGDITHG